MVDERTLNTVKNPMESKWPGMNFLNPEETVIGQILKNDSKSKIRRAELSAGCVRGNATEKIFWDPQKVKVGMITAGGLCPGLNSIIRELTQCLWHKYGVREIYGFQAGWNGLSDMENFVPIELTNDVVRSIHMDGGSILKAARGLRCSQNLLKLGKTRHQHAVRNWRRRNPVSCKLGLQGCP